MRIATWNVRTLNRIGAMKELVKDIYKYKVDIYAPQEIRWPRKGAVIKKLKRKYCLKMREAISFKTGDSCCIDVQCHLCG
jgi:exonuclease III